MSRESGGFCSPRLLRKSNFSYSNAALPLKGCMKNQKRIRRASRKIGITVVGIDVQRHGAVAGVSRETALQPAAADAVRNMGSDKERESASLYRVIEVAIGRAQEIGVDASEAAKGAAKAFKAALAEYRG